MRGQVCVVSLTAAACFTLAAAGLRADEVCDSGFRSPTADEEAAMRVVVDGALLALPAQLEGWVGETSGGLDVSSQCMDDPPRPWEYGVVRRFDRVDDVEERERLSQEAAASYQSARQSVQPTTDAIMARIQELSLAAVAAAEAGDYARVDEINVQIERASAEFEAVMSGTGAAAALDAATEELSRDHSIRITLEVNPGFESLGYEFGPAATPVGASHAFRWPETAYSPTDETRLLLFGSWTVAGDRAAQVLRAGVAEAVPQGIAVRVTADESRIESLVAGIDSAALAALMSR